MVESTIQTLILERVRCTADEQVPEHMVDSLMLYLTDGVQPGDFLTLILENDFAHAAGKADMKNQRALFGWAVVLGDLPMGAWGSPEKVAVWIEGKGMRAWETQVREG